jgi:predicted transcriptional regulator
MVCERLAEGESLGAIGRDPAMPTKATVRRWCNGENEAPPEFADRYARARRDGLDHLAEETEEMVRSEPDVQRARLIVDTRKWLLSKLRPERYGDKLEVSSTSKNVNYEIPSDLTAEEAARRYQELAGR